MLNCGNIDSGPSTETRERFDVGLFQKATLLVLPLIAYAWAYEFELGYCGAFGVPAEFVHVSISELLLPMVAIAGSAMGIFYLAEFFHGVIGDNKTPVHNGHHLAFYMFLCGLPVPLLLLVDHFPYGYWYLWVAFILVCDLGRSAFKNRGWPTAATIRGSKAFDVFPNTRERLGPLFPTLMVGLIGGLLAHGIGEHRAAVREDFAVLSDQPNRIVVRWYGDKIIVAELNPLNHRVTGNVGVLPVGSTEARSFKSLHLGKLGIGS